MTAALSDDFVTAVIQAPFGRLRLSVRDGALERLEFVGDEVVLSAPRDWVGREAAAQLQAYFRRPDVVFSFPLRMTVSPFRLRVLQALQQIPRGEVRSYGALARELGTSARAVGGACRANPLPVVVPCHRVVAVAGIGGFAGRRTGPELARKRWLLAHEGAKLPFAEAEVENHRS